MSRNNQKHNFANRVINEIFQNENSLKKLSLEEIFESRLKELNTNVHQVTKILNVDRRTLTEMLRPDAKKIDLVTVQKLADFLGFSQDDVLDKFFSQVTAEEKEEIRAAKKRSFIVNNFDLLALKRMGLIDSVADFENIEKSLIKFLGYEDIFDHKQNRINALFSQGKRRNNKLNLELWYAAARQSLEATPNPNYYYRDKLIKYFPNIRHHSMNVETGLMEVSKNLFELGITLIVIPKFNKDVHIRGMTMIYRHRPCIVLTNYSGFYATLWFALLHELYHVLYDLEVIRKYDCHFTGDSESDLINEANANEFAREYLFPEKKMKEIESKINQPHFIKYYAEQNHIHPSIIYTFYSWDQGKSEPYKKFHQHMGSINMALKPFKYHELEETKTIKETSKERNSELKFI